MIKKDEEEKKINDNEENEEEEEGDSGDEEGDENQEEQKQDDDQPKQAQVSGDKEIALQRYLTLSKTLCFLIVIFDIAFAEFLCMYRQICDFTNVEIPSPYGTTVIIFLFITIIFTIFNYYLIDTLNRDIIDCFKYITGIWALVVITFAILCFIQETNMEDNDNLQEVWDNLTPFSQSYYSGIEDLQEINENNLTFAGIYYIITGVILLILFVVTSNMKSSMPQTWRPRTQILNPGCESHQVILEKRKKDRLEALKNRKYVQEGQIQTQKLNQTQYKQLQHDTNEDEEFIEDPNRRAKARIPEGLKEGMKPPYRH